MPTTKLKEFLKDNRVAYQVIPHALAYSAKSVAGTAHIPGKELAKTVVVDLDGHHALAVVPSTRKVDLALLGQAAGAASVKLVKERDFRGEFPECEPGAMPPFGNLYGLPVYVEPHLAADALIAFNAGNHTELIRMAYRDFERLAHPTITNM